MFYSTVHRRPARQRLQRLFPPHYGLLALALLGRPARPIGAWDALRRQRRHARAGPRGRRSSTRRGRRTTAALAPTRRRREVFRDGSDVLLRLPSLQRRSVIQWRMRQGPSRLPADESLNDLREQGLYRALRVLDGEQKAHTLGRPPLGRQSLVEQLSRPDDAPAAARARARGARRRFGVGTGLGAHDRRHDGDPHGARAAARGVQEDRGRRRLPERLHGQRRHRLVDPRQGRRHRLRRAESRQHHRRRAPEPRDDQGVSAPRRRRRARRSSRTLPRGQRDAAHHRRRVQHGRRPRRRCRRCATWPTSSAAS